MIEHFGVKPSLIVAAFAGGVASVFFMRNVSAVQALASAVVGTFTGVYLAPLGVAWLATLGLGGAGEETSLAAAFVTGLTGMATCQGLLEVVNRWWRKKIDGMTPPPPGGGEA